MAVAMVLGVLWYLIAHPARDPVRSTTAASRSTSSYFYGSYGGSIPEIAENDPAPSRPRRLATRIAARPHPVLSRPAAAVGWSAAGSAPLQLLMAAAADAGQRDRRQPVRPHDQVPVHGGDDRPDRDRRDRGRPRLWRFRIVRRVADPVAGRSGPYVTNVAWSTSPIGNDVLGVGHANARQSSLDREVSTRPRRRLGHGDLRAVAAPGAPRADLRLAEPVPGRRTGATTTPTGCPTRRRSSTSSSTANRSARRSARCSQASSMATRTGSCSISRTSSWLSASAPVDDPGM